MKQQTVFLFTFLITLTLSLSNPPRKQLGGPPSTFQEHSIWEEIRTSSKSALLNVHLSQTIYSDDESEIGMVSAQVKVPVDNGNDFELVFGSPVADKLSLTFVAPSGKVIDLSGAMTESGIPVGSTGQVIPVSFYSLDLVETGFYTLTITMDGANEDEIRGVMTNSVPDAFVLVENDDNLIIEAMLLSPVISSQSNVGLKVHLLVDGQELSATAGRVTITEALIDVLSPSGQEVAIEMNDDGLLADEQANDDYYSGSISLTEVGDYQFEAIISGWIQETNGIQRPFTKTVQYLIPAAEGKVNIKGTAKLEVKSSQRALIHIDMELPETLTVSDLPNYRAYTEVYIQGKHGQVAAAWIGAIVNIIDSVITLELDMDWVNMVKTVGPLVLKNTYLVNLQTETAIASHQDDISVENSKIWEMEAFRGVLGREVTEITQEMREGVRTVHLSEEEKATTPTLILIHGYCAGVNPFPTEDFTDAAFFLNPDANIATDDFAIKVYEYAESIGAKKFSTIGHSQGGMVSLHLLNYYETGLDSVSGGRKIQTVGTPWRGCSGAGSISNLAKAFGVTCGENKDLTKNGAQTWLSGMSAKSKKEVYFYTTTYKQGKFGGDYCNIAVNLILKWPNDGTAELELATLPGGNNMGNTQKQCHTTGMKYESQCKDKTRNHEMNSLAARN